MPMYSRLPNWFVFPLSRIRIMGWQGVRKTQGKHVGKLELAARLARSMLGDTRKSAAVRMIAGPGLSAANP
jgi:hypothetical protein